MTKACLLLLTFVTTSAIAGEWRPRALTIAADGTLYVADAALPGIWQRRENGEFVLKFRAERGDGSPLRAPTALTVDREGNLFVADSATGEVYRLDREGKPIPLSRRAFEVPTGLAIGDSGDLFVCDLRLNLVARLPRAGGKPEPIARIAAPRGLAIDKDGGLFVVSMRTDQLVKVSQKGEVKTIVKGSPFRMPLGIALDRRSGGVWVADGDDATVWHVSPTGEIRKSFSKDVLVRPVAVATGQAGELFVADSGARTIARVSASGQVEQSWTGPNSVESRRKRP